MKTGIIFDLDGTLLDTLQDLADAVNYALRNHGYPERSLSQVRDFVGNGAGRLIRLSVPDGTGEAAAEQVLATFQDYYKAHAQRKTCPYEGIPEALEKLSSRYPLAVVSNKPDAAVKILCKQYFPGLYAVGETGDCPRKPAPDMLKRAMEAIKVDTCIYVGDSEVDVRTSKNAGVPCLTVLWGFRDAPILQQEGATHFCDDPKKLAECLITMIESKD